MEAGGLIERNRRRGITQSRVSPNRWVRYPSRKTDRQRNDQNSTTDAFSRFLTLGTAILRYSSKMSEP